jgi:PKD repeat protein
VAGAAVSALAIGPLTAVSATADTTPVPPATQSTVTADSLPTVQVDGVVWSQVVVGNTVYVTGEFTSARPAGAAAGTDESPRSNLLAYDIRTGELITSWAPTLNAQGLSITASADGTKIFVGGDFTNVSGVAKNRIVALDAITGAVQTSFVASVNSRVRALAIGDGVLYAGGLFTTSSGQPRSRLAAFSVGTGALLSWAPAADREVMALTAPANSGTVVVGGRFSTLNGVANYGLGAVDASTGTALTWPANTVVKNAGDNAAIYSLSNDGTQVYGTGYTYGSGGNLENSFATDTSGNLNWVVGCLGDTYSSAPIGGVLYIVSHTHNCSQIGGWPQTTPWTYQHATAFSTTAGTHGETNLSGNFTGLPAPELLHWSPTLDTGTYTGQGQAAWSVAGNSQYVVLGGEFPRVNYVAQQGLTRFAVKGLATNKQGPTTPEELTPSATAVGTGALRVSWEASWDRDNRRLSYEVLRDGVVVGQLTADSTWWDRPTLSYTDTSATPGSSVTYKIRVRDATNVITGAEASFTAPATSLAAGSYADTVRADGASSYWRLGEPSGRTAYDWTGARDLTLSSTATRGSDGAMVGSTDPSTTFVGGTTGVAAGTSLKQLAPEYFSEEAWFKTTTTLGGKIIGFGSSSTGDSSTADRHVYLSNTGQLNYGVTAAGTARTITSTSAYNDGQWHHVVAALGAAGMQLYVDGTLVGTQSDTTFGQSYYGYWRLAGDAIGTAFPNRPTRTRLDGQVDEVAIYPVVLTGAQVLRHYQIGRGLNQAPTAAFTSTSNQLVTSFDGSSSSDPDGSIASYAWDFGDGSTGTGVSPTHTYPAAGTYSVVLTVTDNGAGTGTVSHDVTVTVPPPVSTVATDTFTRTVASGWGTADTGGAWTSSGGTSSVADGAGVVSVPAGVTGSFRLGSTSTLDADVQHRVWLDALPTGGGVYLSDVVHRTSTGDYRGKVRVMSTGAVQVQFSKVVGATETALTTASTVSGLTYQAGLPLAVRTQASGSSPTTLRIKVWTAGTAEPSDWQQTVTDSTDGLQVAGNVGFVAYTSSSATAPVVVHYDDLLATLP